MKITALEYTGDQIIIDSPDYGKIFGCTVILDNFWYDGLFVYPTKILCDYGESSIVYNFKHLKYVYDNGKYVGEKIK